MRSSIRTVNDKNLFFISIVRRIWNKLDICHKCRSVPSKQWIGEPVFFLIAEILTLAISAIRLWQYLVNVEILTVFIGYEEVSSWRRESNKGDIFEERRMNLSKKLRCLKIANLNGYHIFFTNSSLLRKRHQRLIFWKILIWVKPRSFFTTLYLRWLIYWW